MITENIISKSRIDCNRCIFIGNFYDEYAKCWGDGYIHKDNSTFTVICFACNNPEEDDDDSVIISKTIHINPNSRRTFESGKDKINDEYSVLYKIQEEYFLLESQNNLPIPVPF